jgi:hypothetical protein
MCNRDHHRDQKLIRIHRDPIGIAEPDPDSPGKIDPGCFPLKHVFFSHHLQITG